MQLNKTTDFLSVFSLGNSRLESIRIFCLYAYLRFKRLIGLSTNFKNPIKLNLKFQNKPFIFYIKYILDFHLLKEMFVDEIYRHDLLESPKVIVDAGSNIGASVIYFRLIYPNSRIIAIEPHPGCLEVLNMNAKNYNIEVTPAALSSASGTSKFYFNTEHWSASLFDRGRNDKAVDVDCLSLDDLIVNKDISYIDVLKIDIEGAEYEIFEKFNHKDSIGLLLGELHPKITKKNFEDFNILVPKYQLLSKRDEGGHINIVYKNKSLT